MPNAPTFASRVGVRPEKVDTMPLVPHDQYPNLMVMDIGLVPLTNMPFNRSKSDIKGLEYSAAGIPFIASNLDAYLELQHQLGVGRIAKKPISWAKHIKELSDYRVRQEEADIQREIVRKERDISIGTKLLTDVISNL